MPQLLFLMPTSRAAPTNKISLPHLLSFRQERNSFLSHKSNACYAHLWYKVCCYECRTQCRKWHRIWWMLAAGHNYEQQAYVAAFFVYLSSATLTPKYLVGMCHDFAWHWCLVINRNKFGESSGRLKLPVAQSNTGPLPSRPQQVQALRYMPLQWNTEFWNTVCAP